MSVQPNRTLDSVLEDPEQSSHNAAQSNSSSLLPPIGSTTSLSGRRKSFTRRNSFGISSIPALAAAQAHSTALNSQSRLDTIQSVPETTLKPNAPLGSEIRPVSRAGVISLDAPPKEEKAAVAIEPQLDSTGKPVRKKYNVPESTRSKSFVRKASGFASVGSYDPFPDSWKDRRHSIAWSRSNSIRFAESKSDLLGPASYNPSYNFGHTGNTIKMANRSSKPQNHSSNVSNNPDIGPTTYSVEIVKRNRGFVPWVKKIQSSLSRVVDFKTPLPPTTHIELIAQFAESPIKPKTAVIFLYCNTRKK